MEAGECWRSLQSTLKVKAPRTPTAEHNMGGKGNLQPLGEQHHQSAPKKMLKNTIKHSGPYRSRK